MLRSSVRYLFVGLLTLGIGCGKTAGSPGGLSVNPKPITAHYIPFELQTYTPVTPESIERDAVCVFPIDKGSELSDAIEEIISQSSNGKFAADFVRLKVTGVYAAPLLIDARGGVRLEGLPEKKLEPEDMDRLNTMLRSFASSVGCRI